MWALAFSAALLGGVGTAAATHLATDTEGHTTLEQILAGSGTNFKTLSVQQVAADYIVRDPMGVAQAGRESRRRSLAYFSQLTDFQLSDEESPARVEFLDQVAGQDGAPSAWRPWEALIPFMIDDSIRQVNRFAAQSPVPQGNGAGNAMDFALATGDQADNQQRNEMIWTRALLEGGVTLNFNSGLTAPNAYSPANLPDPVCQSFVAQEGGPQQAAAEGARYTGVQDYSDYPPGGPGPDPIFYDPNQPTGDWANWPRYTGLMDRAEMLSMSPQGLDVPSYWVNGNHDVLVQGNEDANQAFEKIAMGCFKALGTTAAPKSVPGPDGLDPSVLLSPTSAGMLVPPDPLRRFVSKKQVKAIIGANDVDDDHGFGFVDAAQNTASNGTASYYAWNPPQTPEVRFVAIDTNSEGGVVGDKSVNPVVPGSSDGNLDDPQFRWLKGELDEAQEDGKLVVIFGHHPVRTMNTEVPDEAASPCTVNDSHGDDPEHDVNPGCDADPRSSEPIHLGSPEQAEAAGNTEETFTELVNEHPNVIAYVAGHTHEHQLLPCGTPREQGKSDTRFCHADAQGNVDRIWWELNTSAVADWPHQHRLIDVMDNRDGTISIFGTVLDHASPATAPGTGAASSFSSTQLASIGRTFGFNDPQTGPPAGEGTPLDRNVEMVLADPRPADLQITKSDGPDPVKLGRRLTYTLAVKNLGPSGAAGVTVTDPLPAGVQLTSTSTTAGSCALTGDTVTCNLGDMSASQTATVRIDVKVQGTPRTLTNTATVDSITDDPVAANDASTATTRVVR